MKHIRFPRIAVFHRMKLCRKTKIYKLVKRNILETLVDMYDDDSTKTNITVDSLEPRARKKVCHAFKRDILRIRQYKRGIIGIRI